MLLTWGTLVLFGVGPAAVVLALSGTRGERRDESVFAMPAAEARGRAQALDAHLRRWLSRCGEVAGELSALLSQLPDGPIGSAAEGTLMMHLQSRLSGSFEGEMGELGVLAPDGRMLLSTDGTRAGAKTRERNLEAALAAERPAAALVGAGRLVVAAPLRVRGTLRGILVARLRSEVAARVVRAVTGGVDIFVLDANGAALTGRAVEPALAELGGESSAGTRWVKGRPAALVPLARARAVVVAVGPVEAEGRPAGAWWCYGVGLAAMVTLAGIAAWRLTRRRV